MSTKASNSRDRILDCAWALARERGTTSVGLAEIGRAAGVSRQAVYLHFDSRGGLLTAMARRHDERSGFYGRMLEAGALPPREALERMVRLWCDYIPEILPVARALEAALATGDEGADAWRDRMRDLRGAYRRAIRGLEAEGRLAPGWSVGQATDWVYARTHVTQYEHLVGERDWPPGAYADRLVRSLLAELVAA